ncbi:MAG: DHHA1 domain-containing protein, partial [Porticoccus sp.]
ASLDSVDPKALRDTVDQLKNKLGSAVILLAVPGDEKVALVAGVTSDTTDRVKAGELMQFVAAQLGGKGGGRPDMAQGGGTDVAALPSAIDSVFEWVEQKLGS